MTDISHFIDTKHKSYAKYVIHNRAIPNIIDGLKPSQRKVLFTALNHCRKTWLKTASLVGYVIAKANYHHGDTPLANAINLMVQDFPGTNNVPLLIGKGNFGNRLITECAASRYTSVKVSPDFDKWFKDFGVMDKSFDPDNPEPKNYLPIIPWVLVNGVRGIAVGFATNILPRNPSNLVKLVKLILKDPNIKSTAAVKRLLLPTFSGFEGTICEDSEGGENSWMSEGLFVYDEKKKITITELPIGYDREKYIRHLSALQQKKKIASFGDYSRDTFHFVVRLLKPIADRDKIVTLLNLRTKFTENIVVITEDGVLKEYDDPLELVKHFVKYRKKKYKERILKNIKDAENEMKLIEEKMSLIYLVENKEITLTKLKKKELLKVLKDKGFKFAKEIINTPIFRFTMDEMLNLANRKTEMMVLAMYYVGTNAEEQWLNDFKQIRGIKWM